MQDVWYCLDGTLLHVVCNEVKIEKIEQLLALGAEVNTNDSGGWTTIHEACCYGKKAVLEQLVNSLEIDLFCMRVVDFGITNGTSAFHDAVASHYLQIAHILLEK